MVRLALLFVSMLAVHANLRGTQDFPAPDSSGSMCVAPQGSCGPVQDRCCQGPGLMTCRLRPTMVKGDEGTAYVCGKEFPEEVNPKCAAEGEECGTDDHCCEIDPTLQVGCQKVSVGTKVKHVCKAKLNNAGESMEGLCVAEGSSCNPLENRCCQEGPQGDKALRTCQLKFFDKPGQHGMAYSCAKEQA
ncbi:unnamed protein product [Cladocopium goreaui]|uniref:Uncharacterized protein n=1 Tax=Cladocopium goreaui TaxID=2562237 RepID=A0A9P1BYM7_9DINO|nr:unnamed protein product [Cladocopium goreaui]